MADLVLPRVGFGGANLGNLYAPMTDDDADAVLQAAWDGGVRYFDTAPHYGLGLAERRLGRFLAGRPRAEYVVSTKVGRLLRPSPGTADRLDMANLYAVPAAYERVWDPSPAGVRRSLEESLERLGLDRVDALFLHDPDEYDLGPSLASGIPALAALRDEGLVGAVGVGSKSTEALLAGARSGALDLLMVAGRYTLLEQAEELITACRGHGVGIVAAGVLNSGLLALPRPAADARYDYVPAPDDILARARRLADLCAEHGVDLPTAALQFPLRDATVRAVVLGAATAGQVRENLARLRTPVPDALWDAVRGTVPA
jgi:D-threo-aldose 1-dehydrogenase